MNYPLWIEIILALSLSVALMGLGAWMVFGAITKAINAARKLEDRRSHRETEALDNWKQAYDAEHAEHLQDVAELSAELNKLRRDIERKNALLAKVKVADL